MKQTIFGAVLAVALAVVGFGGYKAYVVVKQLRELVQLSEEVAHDTKTGQKYSAADVLREIAQERIQQLVQQQQAAKAAQTPQAGVPKQ